MTRPHRLANTRLDGPAKHLRIHPPINWDAVATAVVVCATAFFIAGSVL